MMRVFLSNELAQISCLEGWLKGDIGLERNKFRLRVSLAYKKITFILISRLRAHSRSRELAVSTASFGFFHAGRNTREKQTLPMFSLYGENVGNCTFPLHMTK